MKNVCVEIGGVVKSMAAKASKHEEEVLTPRQLHAWACKELIGIMFFYISYKMATNMT
jgi:hypothetical protein